MPPTSTKAYVALDKYLQRQGIGRDRIDTFFADPANWPSLARQVVRATNDIYFIDSPKAEDVRIEDAVAAPYSAALLRWRFRNKPVLTLGDLQKHPRSRIAKIAGLGIQGMQAVDTALASRQLTYLGEKPTSNRSKQ